MAFNEKLKKAMQELGITQKQLVGITGIHKSSISQYLAGNTIPTEERQKDMALSLGLAPDYFAEKRVKACKKLKKTISANCGVERLSVVDAAKLLGINHDTVRKGLQQGVFPWGYAIQTRENRWVYFVNAARFAEIEKIKI